MLRHDPDETFVVAADWQLASKAYYREYIWRPARELDDDIGSGRRWIHALKMIDELHGRYRYPDGAMFDYPELEELFPESSERWIRNFLKPDKTGEAPATYASTSAFDRLRIVELYCRLRREGRTAF